MEPNVENVVSCAGIHGDHLHLGVQTRVEPFPTEERQRNKLLVGSKTATHL